MRSPLIKLAGATLLILVLMTSADANELTLDDCIEQALKNRSSIVAARGAETVAKADQRWALGQFLPRVNASYSYSKTKTTDIEPDQVITYVADSMIQQTVIGTDTAHDLRYIPGFETVKSADQDRTSKTFDVRASMDLFNLANFFNYAGARADRAKAHLDVIRSEQDLIYSVKLAYYAYLASAENVTVQEGAVKRSQEQLKLIQSKYDLGSASLSDVLKQKVQSGNDRLSLLTAQNGVVSSRATLAYTVGLDPLGDIEFSSTYNVRQYDGGLNDAVGFGLSHEPGLLAAQKRVDAAKHGLRSRKAEYLPKLVGFGSLSWSDATRGDTLIYDFSSRDRTFGLQVSWNIFDGFARERSVAMGKVNQNNARASMADIRNLLVSSIKTAYMEIDQYKEAKTVASENVEAAEEDLKITQEKYNLGAATILDLLDAQVSLKQAQVSLIRAGFDMNLAVAKLENAMGKM
ncbi:MAG: TolC family protein [candidate division Zixibacteria bacterium]|nr:TolC family protein [candidate division Zixibacteria bacterium]